MKKADIVIADTVIKSGAIFTPKGVVAGGVAIQGNKILQVSDVSELEGYIGPATRILEYPEGFLMPGFHDSHVHVLMGALYNSNVNLGKARSEEESAKMVKEYADLHPEESWVIGFNWYHIYWDIKNLPTRASLDMLFPDRPVFLINAEAHGIWVNTKALEIAGVTKDTVCPAYGEIIRDETGEPTGVFLERAIGLIAPYALRLLPEKQTSLLKKFNARALSMGVTAVNDMLPYFGLDIGDLGVYLQYVENEKAGIRIHLTPGLNQSIGDLIKLRDKYNSEKLRIASLKEFLDGVPTTYTALLVDSYADKPETAGSGMIDEKLLFELVSRAHLNDFPVRLHACGDGAVRMALDSFENAVNQHGAKDIRHSIEHVECVHPDDIKRFRELGVIASMQPEHMAITEVFDENPYPERYGKDRDRYLWAFNDLLDNGAHICLGSDYPVVDIDPFLEIYRAATRLHNDGKPEGGWNPDQKMKMEDILKAYTYGSAYVSGVEDRIGSIEEGKYADLIVLDRNLMTIDPEQIRDTKVLLTMVNGEIAYLD